MIISFGYLRVSTEQQNLERQYAALKKFKEIPEENIFADKVSGKTENREEYQTMKLLIQRLVDLNNKRPEEQRDKIEVIIEELDRLGRTKKIIVQEMRWFSDRGVRLRILEIPTTLIEIDSSNDWVLSMANNIILEVYTALAEQELIKKEKRQREGIEQAKLKGVYKGRKPIDIDKEMLEKTYKRWKEGEITARKAMELLNLKANTFYRNIKKYESEIN